MDTCPGMTVPAEHQGFKLHVLHVKILLIFPSIPNRYNNIVIIVIWNPTVIRMTWKYFSKDSFGSDLQAEEDAYLVDFHLVEVLFYLTQVRIIKKRFYADRCMCKTNKHF